MPKSELEEFAQIASDWFWQTDANHRFVYLSERFETVTGIPITAAIGRNRLAMAAERQNDPAWRRQMRDLQEHRAFRDWVYEGVNPITGERYWIRSSGTPQFDPNGVFIGFIGAASDITDEVKMRLALENANERLATQNHELKAAAQHIAHQANHDALTGLPNRRSFEDHIAKLAAGQAQVAILHVDLDRFKQINDTMGHAAGDAALRHAAHVLQNISTCKTFVARIGGDEFVVLCHCPSVAADAAAEIVSALGEPALIDGTLTRLGASVGYTRSPHRAWSPNELLIDADLALYEAKREGRNCARVFTTEMRERAVAERRTADDIVDGLRNGAFFPVFQPQFDPRTREIVGLEALARWRHPTRGLLTPDQFLPIAEELKLVGELDRTILEQALRAGQFLQARLGVAPRIAVNVSAQRLMDPRLIDDVDALASLRSGPLSFELLETIFFEEMADNVSEAFDALRARGIELEVDDFGSGRASISSMLKVQPDRMKICHSLIRPALDSEQQRRLVEAILQIGRVMDIKVVGEGVETEEHVRFMNSLGCEIVQGFAFSRPVPLDDVVALLERQRDICAA